MGKPVGAMLDNSAAFCFADRFTHPTETLDGREFWANQV
jgi:hypothetical protein